MLPVLVLKKIVVLEGRRQKWRRAGTLRFNPLALEQPQST